MDSDDDGLSASQALEYERLGSPDKAYYGKDPAVMRRLQEERRVAEAGRQGRRRKPAERHDPDAADDAARAVAQQRSDIAVSDSDEDGDDEYGTLAEVKLTTTMRWETRGHQRRSASSCCVP